MASNKALLTALAALILLGGTPAMAQGPTATPGPTVTPYPLPTGQFGDLRTTPTPWVINPLATHNWGGGEKAGDVADSIINGYRYINFGSTETSAGVIDLLVFVAMVFLVLRAMWGVIGATSSASEDDD